jgi:hypothetical protein
MATFSNYGWRSVKGANSTPSSTQLTATKHALKGRATRRLTWLEHCRRRDHFWRWLAKQHRPELTQVARAITLSALSVVID